MAVEGRAPLTAEGDSSPSRREGQRHGPTGRRRRQVATSVMTQRPDPAWYLLDADTSAPTRLPTDEGRPEPGLSSDAERALADLAAAVHATAWRLGERELRQLEALIGMQRWVR